MIPVFIAEDASEFGKHERIGIKGQRSVDGMRPWLNDGVTVEFTWQLAK